jgi:hypothetical protein
VMKVVVLPSLVGMSTWLSIMAFRCRLLILFFRLRVQYDCKETGS